MDTKTAAATTTVIGLDEEAGVPEDTIVLQAENTSFKIERKVAYLSKLVKTALQQDKTATEVKVRGIKDPKILGYIVEYMKHHQGKPGTIVEKPLRSKVMSEVCEDKWDAQFIDGFDKRSNQELYDLILGVNYMDIKCLLHLACAKVASLIKGQPLEKIKDILDPERKVPTTTTTE